MRGTVAKQLRKMARFHPSDRPNRKYVSEKTKRYDTGKTDKDGKKVIIEMNCLALADSEPRALYQELKKEYKQFGHIS